MWPAIVPLLLFRHLHFFVIVSNPQAPPQIRLHTKQFFNYADVLLLTVYEERGQKLLSASIPMGEKFERALPCPSSACSFYIVQADPGMNGATFECDNPWAVLGSIQHRIGVNGPGPPLYFYLPSECLEITLGAQAFSPNEGGRIVLFRPDGQIAGVLDGELDTEERIKIAVPQEMRNQIWTLSWSQSLTSTAELDDLNFWLEGKLTPLLFPQKEWAQQYGKILWERDKAAREAEGLSF